MNNYLLLADVSSKAQHKFLSYLIIVLLFVLVVIGLVADNIKKMYERRAKEIDLYCVDYCTKGILAKPNDVPRYVFKREKKNLYLRNRWIIRAFLILSIAFILIIALTDSYSFKQCVEIIKDLKITLDWPKGEFFGIKNFVIGWPDVTHSPTFHGTFIAYITYIMLVASILFIIRMMDQGCLFIAKIIRSKKIKVDAFQKTVDINKGL